MSVFSKCWLLLLYVFILFLFFLILKQLMPQTKMMSYCSAYIVPVFVYTNIIYKGRTISEFWTIWLLHFLYHLEIQQSSKKSLKTNLNMTLKIITLILWHQKCDSTSGVKKKCKQGLPHSIRNNGAEGSSLVV